MLGDRVPQAPVGVTLNGQDLRGGELGVGRCVLLLCAAVKIHWELIDRRGCAALVGRGAGQGGGSVRWGEGRGWGACPSDARCIDCGPKRGTTRAKVRPDLLDRGVVAVCIRLLETAAGAPHFTIFVVLVHGVFSSPSARREARPCQSAADLLKITTSLHTTFALPPPPRTPSLPRSPSDPPHHSKTAQKYLGDDLKTRCAQLQLGWQKVVAFPLHVIEGWGRLGWFCRPSSRVSTRITRLRQFSVGIVCV